MDEQDPGNAIWHTLNQNTELGKLRARVAELEKEREDLRALATRLLRDLDATKDAGVGAVMSSLSLVADVWNAHALAEQAMREGLAECERLRGELQRSQWRTVTISMEPRDVFAEQCRWWERRLLETPRFVAEYDPQYEADAVASIAETMDRIEAARSTCCGHGCEGCRGVGR